MESRKCWRWVLGVAVVCGSALGVSAGTSQAQILVSSSPAEIEQGGSAGVTFSISGTSNNVATYNAEVEIDAANVDIVCGVDGTCTGCTIDPRLTVQILQVTRPRPDALIFFVGDTAPPVGTFGDGPLFTCTFAAPATATPGVYAFSSEFLEVGDASGNVLPANDDYGDLTVIVPPPTPTNTATAAVTATNTPLPTNTATLVPTRTNTSAPTSTRTITPTANISGADDGCSMNPNAGSMSLWLLLPLVALPLARQRNRGR
jgi:hypothetical protein